jgi:hypothetical protein
MGDRKDLQSPVRRAKLSVMTWLDLLPKDAQMDATMALDKLCDVAEAQIEQAYFDGSNNHMGAVQSRPFRQAQS